MSFAIVGCGQRKRYGDGSLPARDLYCGPLFTAARRHVESRDLDWQILSGKHGLIRPDHVVAPYDWSLAEQYAELDRLDVLTSSGGDHRERWIRVQAGRLGHWLSGLIASPGRPPVSGEPITVEMHAGAMYVALVREAASMWMQAHPSYVIEVADPLAGLELGHRLRWYAQAYRESAALARAVAP